MTTLNLRQFKVLTFDCYGTLVDWEAGILAGLRPLLERHSVTRADEEILERYGRYEARIEAGAYRKYKDVLRDVVEQFGAEFGFDAHPDLNVLVDTFDGWRPFADTVDALRSLHRHYQLMPLTNVDDDLFAITAAQLQVPFDKVMTAEQIGSYKPSPRNFEYMLAHVGVPKEQVLHVAQSLYHDIAPARSLGIATVWINRRQGKTGAGATPPANAQPDMEVPDMRTLAELARQAFDIPREQHGGAA